MLLIKDLSWVIHCVGWHISQSFKRPLCVCWSVRGGFQILINPLTFLFSLHVQAVHISVSYNWHSAMHNPVCKGSWKMGVFQAGHYCLPRQKKKKKGDKWSLVRQTRRNGPKCRRHLWQEGGSQESERVHGRSQGFVAQHMLCVVLHNLALRWPLGFDFYPPYVLTIYRISGS